MKDLRSFLSYRIAVQHADYLREQGIFATVSGAASRGYTLLVNEKDYGTANEVLTALEHTPEAA